MQEKPDIYGKLLQEARELRNMTRAELARKTGFSIRAIEYWECGKRHMSMDSANVVFDTLKVTVAIGYKTKYNKVQLLEEEFVGDFL